MTILEYAQPDTQKQSRWMTVFANASLFFPLVVLGLLYGEWLLGWAMLGHPPQPSLDDPKSINGSSWLHGFAGIALMSALPASWMAAGFNLYLIAGRPGLKRSVLRVAMLLILWLGMFALIHYDPWLVLDWWLD